MNKKIVRRDVDLANPPPLTEKQRSELAALAAKSDRDINCSDIADEEILERGSAQPVLQAHQDLENRSHRLRRAGLAAGAGEGLPNSDERHPAPRDGVLDC
jgi:hypothetical protein